MTADLYELLTAVADSAPVPALLDGVRARRRRALRRRAAAFSTGTVAVAMVGGVLTWQAHRAEIANRGYGAAAGFEHVAGPSGWPSARLTPTLEAPILSFHGSGLRLDPLPGGYRSAITAEKAYALCVQHYCDRNAGMVLTLGAVTGTTTWGSLVLRPAWLSEMAPSRCGQAPAVAVAGVLEPSLPRWSEVVPTPAPDQACRLVAVRDASSGADLGALLEAVAG